MMVQHCHSSQIDSAASGEAQESVVRTAARAVLAGQQTPERSVIDMSADYRRLEDIGAELNLMFAYRIEAETCFAHMCKAGRPILNLGKSIGLKLSVEIDPASGHFVLYEESGPAPSVLVTANEERLVDQIISIAASACEHLTPHTVDGAIEALVGQSLADVERRLLLRTMHYFRGNGSQAAFALGVSEDDLVALMRRCLVEVAPVRPSVEGRQ